MSVDVRRLTAVIPVPIAAMADAEAVRPFVSSAIAHMLVPSWATSRRGTAHWVVWEVDGRKRLRCGGRFATGTGTPEPAGRICGRCDR